MTDIVIDSITNQSSLGSVGLEISHDSQPQPTNPSEYIFLYHINIPDNYSEEDCLASVGLEISHNSQPQSTYPSEPASEYLSISCAYTDYCNKERNCTWQITGLAIIEIFHDSQLSLSLHSYLSIFPYCKNIQITALRNATVFLS